MAQWLEPKPRTPIVAPGARSMTGGGTNERAVRAGKRPVGDSVTVEIAVTLEGCDLGEVLGREHLAAVPGLVRVTERLGHPDVHSDVEIGQHEDRRLEPLGEIERFHSKQIA